MKYLSLILVLVSTLALAKDKSYRCIGKSSANPSLLGEAYASSNHNIEGAVAQIFKTVDSQNACLFHKIADQQTKRDQIPALTFSNFEYEVANQPQIEPMYLSAFWITKSNRHGKTVTFSPLKPYFGNKDKRFNYWSERLDPPYAACYYICHPTDGNSVADEEN